MKTKVKLSVIMPVRNEGVNLKIMLQILNAIVEVPHEVLIVYDNLDDDSIPVAKELQKKYAGIRPVHNKRGSGVINAVISGAEAAKGKYVLILAADDIGPIFGVEDMIILMEKGCDLVSATRYARGGHEMGGFFMGRILSRLANKLFYLFSGAALTDSTVGIKMFRPSLLQRIKLQAKPVGWAFAFELSMKAQLSGLKLGEVPVVSINRFYGGKSSFKLGSWVMEYTKWFLWGTWKVYSKGKWRRGIAVRIPKNLR